MSRRYACACGIIILLSIASDSTLNFPSAIGRKYIRGFSYRDGTIRFGNTNDTIVTWYFREPQRSVFPIFVQSRSPIEEMTNKGD